MCGNSTMPNVKKPLGKQFYVGFSIKVHIHMKSEDADVVPQDGPL
jgi:hypothetical protein